MNKKKIIIIASASLFIIAIAAYFLFKSSPKDSIHLETTSLTTGKISSSITATGTLEPIIEVTVGTQVSGKISKIYVDYNSVVKKGEILAEIDKTNLQIEYNTQSLTVQSSKVEYDYQKKNYSRAKDLHEKNLISETDFETAKYAYEKAESIYNQNVSNLGKAKTNLSYATIYSPIDGVILSRAVEEGQTVAASFSTPTMFIIARDLTKMQVVANVDEADIGNVKDNQRVTFSVDAYPSDIFEGTVTQVRLNSTTSSNVVTYEVIVNAPNPDLKLKPGLTANITVYTLEKNNIQILPNKALNFIPDTISLSQNDFMLEAGSSKTTAVNQKNVWIQKGRTLAKTTVTIGETDGINTEILAGLNANEKVILDMKQLTAGEKPTNTETSPFMPKRPGSEKK
ncbi:MAG: efflux RND transporter periplasmic adaptor subunit [Paludibacter sp.]|nr:efflux RND transporter periplasmic adaptor subunit [Paludibacter sp.]